ncbi:hypothetical protein GCM10023084_71360 [Streptomyces lacrimifluminis]|uniref:Vegetative cell wall protein gp1 n=1 Tax=Streptomyces lacrimifluminis TaxID=1500077 RepID=A0A917PAS4_9ACTN|nr:hypothetical protein [Streptomyces lacrimifluminis]GGJ69010.1 hypothetical protein GCM10012282_77430 [Streptomyces lacrimifluminis]
MGQLWNELAKKLAERWLTLLVLPGVLYLAVAAIAHTLRRDHALDLGYLSRQITSYAKDPAVGTVGGQVVVLVAVLIGAAALGLAAQALGAFAERLVLAADWHTWPNPFRYLAECWVTVRQRRWKTAHIDYCTQYEAALAPDPSLRPSPTLLSIAANRRMKIAVDRPERPTWTGDRIHAAAIRLDRDHHLDLATVWPYVWLILPETSRTEITQARSALSRAATLAAWAMLYIPLTWWWWPAAPLAVAIGLTARHRIRITTSVYADLLEAATRLNAVALSQTLGIDHTGPLTDRLGDNLTRHLTPRPPAV